MKYWITELSKIGCVMIPGLYKEFGDDIDGCQYFYVVNKYNTLDFGVLGLLDNKYYVMSFNSSTMGMNWVSIEDFIKICKERMK